MSQLSIAREDITHAYARLVKAQLDARGIRDEHKRAEVLHMIAEALECTSGALLAVADTAMAEGSN